MRSKAKFASYIPSLCFFIVVYFCLMPGCKQDDNQAVDTVSELTRIKDSGKIIVGTSTEYPPYEFHMFMNPEEEIVGIDISLGEEIAKALGVDLEIKDMVFSSLFSALGEGDIDIILAGLTPSEERKTLVDFSETYYQALRCILINRSNIDQIKSINDLRGKTVGTQSDSILEDMARRYAVGARLVSKDSLQELVTDLQEGTMDALFLEKPVAESFAFRNDQLAVVECKAGENMLGSAIAVKRGSSELLTEINRILAELRESNKIVEIVENAKILANK